MLDLVDESIQFFEAVGEAASELYAGGFVALEKEGKTQLISTLIIIIFDGIRVWYLGASSAPLGDFAYLSVTNFHAFVIKARAFCKTFYDEIGFSLYALHAEIKPIGDSVGVGLLLKVDLVGVWASQNDVWNIAALEVALEDGWPNRYNFSYRAWYFVYVFVDALPIRFFGAACFIFSEQL